MRGNLYTYICAIYMAYIYISSFCDFTSYEEARINLPLTFSLGKISIPERAKLCETDQSKFMCNGSNNFYRHVTDVVCNEINGVTMKWTVLEENITLACRIPSGQ